MYGTLLCLSCDDFKTLLWATVAQRDINLLQSSQQVDIRFPDGYEPNFTPENGPFCMIENCATYFEAYQHVLRALQQIDVDHFPFVPYLISVKPDVAPPEYLRPSDLYKFNDIFDGGKLSFPVLSEWPFTDIVTTMDFSQLKALKHALTKQVAIIQG